jgi:hypothetical protein
MIGGKTEWGVKYTRESIRDRVVEWEVVILQVFNKPSNDLPRNDQPTPYTGPLVPYQMSEPLILIRSIDFPGNG